MDAGLASLLHSVTPSMCVLRKICKAAYVHMLTFDISTLYSCTEYRKATARTDTVCAGTVEGYGDIPASVCEYKRIMQHKATVLATSLCNIMLALCKEDF